MRRTDRGVRLYSKERGQGQEMLRGLLLSYSLWNFDLVGWWRAGGGNWCWVSRVNCLALREV